MQKYLREQVDWPQAFSEREYAERVGKVRAALAAGGQHTLTDVRL